MITDLLRNDLGKVCEYGSVRVPELVRLELYPHVQHLVSTVEGRLATGRTHFSAFASCFPGGIITGAPKFRAMEIIDELEPVSRGPYTGALGYLGFNRESQLNILIRTAVCRENLACFHVGAGIVQAKRGRQPGNRPAGQQHLIIWMSVKRHHGRHRREHTDAGGWAEGRTFRRVVWGPSSLPAHQPVCLLSNLLQQVDLAGVREPGRTDGGARGENHDGSTGD